MNTQTPFLSIITINYNNKDGLKKTMESVLNQYNVAQNEIEYIIIDGGSTDGSVDVIKDFEKQSFLPLKITKWISEKDSGIYNAMNKGIGMATGQYLHMLNSGDYYYPNILYDIVCILKKEQKDYLLVPVTHVHDGEIESTEIRYKKRLDFASMSHQGIIYSKKLHSEYGLYDENLKYASDYVFCLNALHKNENYSVLYKPSVYFMLGGVGYSPDSIKELKKVRIQYGFEKMPKKDKNIKRFIKLIIPPICVIVMKKIFHFIGVKK